MKGIRLALFWIVLAVAITSVLAESTKIFYGNYNFSANPDDRDLWHMRTDGTNEIRYTTEVDDANAPSVCPDARRVFYDVGGNPGVGRVGGNIYHKRFGAAYSPSEVLDCADIVDPTVGDGVVCLDVDCGPPLPGSNNPRVVFTFVSDSGGGAGAGDSSNIWMATWNAAQGVLEEITPLTNNIGTQNINGEGNKDQHPAWCGPDHVVWSRYTFDESPDPKNEFTICRMQVDANGLVPGSEVCHDTPANDQDDPTGEEDEFTETHPSCGLHNGLNLTIAYSNGRIDEGPTSEPHKICVIDFDFVGPERCTDPQATWITQTMPTWSPDGTKILFVSNENGGVAEVDFDMWVMDYNGPVLPLGQPASLGPNNTDHFEFVPDWAPVPIAGP